MLIIALVKLITMIKAVWFLTIVILLALRDFISKHTLKAKNNTALNKPKMPGINMWSVALSVLLLLQFNKD